MREIVLDTETTGLDYKTGDRIVEVGCVELINHVTTGNNLQFYCSTDKKISEDAFKISGLYNDFLIAINCLLTNHLIEIRRVAREGEYIIKNNFAL